MKKVIHLGAVTDYNDMVGAETLHPLVSVLDFDGTDKRLPGAQPLNFGFYCVYFKTEKTCMLRYGRNIYDYQAGTLVFIAPGQVMTVVEEDYLYQPSGKALLFHPDLLLGTSLAQHMKEYNFFSYDIFEALHLSAQEAQVIFESFQKIDYEIRHAIDKHSRKLIVSNIELFLNYCLRFYDRQFITRDIANASIVAQFERLLQVYFASDRLADEGIPTVSWFAEQVHLSPNYFGDLIRKETGKTVLEYIHHQLLDMAKEKIMDPELSIREIAYQLGFKYPQHFTRFFRQQVGSTPNEYRNTLN